jgi:predicted RNase H-like HicB family nuclease
VLASSKDVIADAKVVMTMLTYGLTATIWKEPKGYVARCSELGAASAGDSPSEAFVNLKEATELYLENVMLIDDLIRIKPVFRSPLPLDNRGTES